MNKINEHLEMFKMLSQSESLKNSVSQSALLCQKAISQGKKVMLCGNGGSMADALHAAAELSGRYLKDRRPLPALALGSNISSISAIGNDYGYEHVFEREVRAFGEKGDILIGISTSGRSKNVLKALEIAKELGVARIALTGANSNSEIVLASDVSICVPSNATPRIQECHIFLLHFLCEVIENSI